MYTALDHPLFPADLAENAEKLQRLGYPCGQFHLAEVSQVRPTLDSLCSIDYFNKEEVNSNEIFRSLVSLSYKKLTSILKYAFIFGVIISLISCDAIIQVNYRVKTRQRKR